MMKTCPNCNTSFEVTYKNKRKKFCNLSCSISFSNKKPGRITDDVKVKISAAMSRVRKNTPDKFSRGKTHSMAVGSYTKGKHKKVVESIYELSSRTRSKVLRRANVKCSYCGWNDEVVDIHHIIPKAKGGTNHHSNLTPLCPNHHRLADRRKLDITKVTTLDKVLGPDWIDLYFG